MDTVSGNFEEKGLRHRGMGNDKSDGGFQAKVEVLRENQVIRYCLTRNSRPLTFGDVLQLWQTDESFQEFFTQLLADSPFPAFRWETPCLTEETKAVPFEFVLLTAPSFATRRTDARTYARYFTENEVDEGVVSFSNLSGDAALVVPSPRTGEDAYGHLAAFVRKAPPQQSKALWRVVGRTVEERMGKQGLWLSTAGGGVAWLHVRMDSRPKYYGFAPYRSS